MSGPGASIYPQSIRRGAVYLMGSALMFSLAGTLVKALTSQLPIEMVVFFRNGAGFLFLLPLILARPALSLQTTRIWDHAVRALSGVLAMYCFFFAISRLPLAEAVALNFTSPLIIPVMAYLILREKLPRFIGGLLILGFLGSMLVIKPGPGTFQPGAALGILSAFFAAFALVNIRKLASTEPAFRIVFYFSFIGSLITVLPMIRVWQTPVGLQWLMLIAVGGLATAGQWLLTRGYASAPAAQVGYYQYSAVIFAGLIDWVIWQDRPDALSVLGVIILCAAGILASRRIEDDSGCLGEATLPATDPNQRAMQVPGRDGSPSRP